MCDTKMKNDDSTGTIKLFVCDKCNDCFYGEKSFKLHNLAHRRHKSFHCPGCHCPFPLKEHLANHLRSTDCSVKLICDICGIKLSNEWSLKRHLNLHNDGGHVCIFCKKTFKTESYLKDHYRVHTGEKAYVCDVCQKSFVYVSNLTKHSRIHSGKVIKKTFNCRICQKTFSSIHWLKFHKCLPKSC